MKINVEINLDYISDSGDLDKHIQENIIERVSEVFKQSVNESVSRKIEHRISVLTDKWIMEQLHEFCDKEIRITDKWGDTVENHMSVKDMFKSKFDEFFNASVDDKGNTLKSCSYGTRLKRVDKMLDDLANKHLKEVYSKMDRAISSFITSKMKEETEREIKEQVVEHLKRMK